MTAADAGLRPDRLVALLQRRGLDRLVVVKRAGPRLIDVTAHRALLLPPAPKSD
jgi:hypothetical protein